MLIESRGLLGCGRIVSVESHCWVDLVLNCGACCGGLNWTDANYLFIYLCRTDVKADVGVGQSTRGGGVLRVRRPPATD